MRLGLGLGLCERVGAVRKGWGCARGLGLCERVGCARGSGLCACLDSGVGLSVLEDDGMVLRAEVGLHALTW